MRARFDSAHFFFYNLTTLFYSVILVLFFMQSPFVLRVINNSRYSLILYCSHNGELQKHDGCYNYEEKISDSILNVRHLVAGPLKNPSTFLLISNKLPKMSTATRLVNKMEPNKQPCILTLIKPCFLVHYEIMGEVSRRIL